MTKNQKIWLIIFMGMFIIPEILWSPTGNFYYELLQSGTSTNVVPLRNNFLNESSYQSTLKIILLFQFVGILGFFTYLLANYGKKDLKFWIAMTLPVILLILSGFALYFIYFFKFSIL